MNNYYIQILVFFILFGSSVIVVAAEQLSGSKKKLPVFMEADQIKGHPHEEVEAIGKVFSLSTS